VKLIPPQTAAFSLKRKTVASSLLLLSLVVAFLPASARTVREKKQFARTQFEVAQRMREALRGRPEDERTAKDYERVMEAYRKVYHTAPTSVKADAAIVAVAELLAESARVLDDEWRFQSAIGQYEFLRKEYPGSKYRFDALFTIGEIYFEDLDNAQKAKENFEEFLKRYPSHRLADDARAELHKLQEDEAVAAGNKSPFLPKALPKSSRRAGKEEKPQQSEKAENSEAAAPADKDKADEHESTAKSEAPPAHTRRLPLVTSVRHWSTPDYTRVAIDIGDEIKYEAGRVPSPDRIFFDLHDTKLASELVGKSFDVDDGFLHKIRVAQFNQHISRVVLEVDDVAEYSAFLLPNPYRLIIDIHGKKPAAPQTLIGAVESKKENVAEDSSESKPNTEAPAKGKKNSKQNTEARVNAAPTQPAEAEPAQRTEKRSGRPAVNKPAESAKSTVPTDDENSTGKLSSDETELTSKEVASLGQNSMEQKATSKPTSAPIVENVAPRESAAETTTTTAKTTSTNASTGIKAESITKRGSSKKASATLSATHAAQPTALGERSLIRALGLKIGKIVVDAGHGGHDTGTIGPNGLREKDLVLDVTLRLGKLLHNKLGADVIYTRDDDTFIPLETRTAIANQNQADLFISIHANSSSDPDARGVETYYLNFTSSPEALEVAARENAVSEKSIHELQDLVKKIALKEKIEESREFAADVEKSLHSGLISKSPGVRNRGVKKAPFIVLIGANMPSILAEISFVSNPTDERKLKTPEYRQKIAESLYRGVAKYVSGLSGIKVASAQAGASGQ
jgi:N-acetylmuramoyl-L-alanine amidase